MATETERTPPDPDVTVALPPYTAATSAATDEACAEVSPCTLTVAGDPAAPRYLKLPTPKDVVVGQRGT